MTKAEGLVSLEEINKNLEQERDHGFIDRREVFDASGASTSLAAHQVRQVVSHVQKMAREIPFGPTAVITTDEMFFGMVRMLGILLELEEGPQVGVFRTFEKGLEWLEQARPS